ncbi:hypothetical protein BVRB_8g196100 [Beta vulgaris subsp. vulgaris]|nr:hypothetical protein BVRB_8g196100 [Beta vulgaris subsp. vulgaris]
MELRNICCSSSSTKIIQLGRHSTNLDLPLKVVTTTTATTTTARSRWRSLWKKLMREKRKIRIFDCSTIHSSQVHLPGYDPKTYAQNFDQGLMSLDDEPDALSRSFSMRFAAPTRLITTTTINSSNKSVVIKKRSVSHHVGQHDHNVVICVF